MLRPLRWQLALAVAGVAVIAIALALLSNRAFEDRPARGGQMVEAVVGTPATLNPLLAHSDVELDVARLLFSGLTRVDAAGEIQPDLASRWSIDDEGRTYTFHLRENATWHDGEPVDAEDVLVTAWLSRDPEGRLGGMRNPLASAWELARVTAVDPRTVRIELEEPYAPFLDATTMGLLPAHVFGDLRPEQVARHPASTRQPVGTGPWRLAQPGGLDDQQIRLSRFDEHWAASVRRPYLDAIVLRFFRTPGEALAALGRREVQAMGGVPSEALARLGDDVTEHNAVTADYTLIYLNPAKQLFTEASVRHALDLALNREAIVSDPDLLDGQAVIADGPIPPGPWSPPREEAPSYNPEAARALLDEAGWIDGDDDGVRDRDGRPLRFALEVFADPLGVAVAERARSDWSAIGVDVEVRAQTQANVVRALTERAYDAALFGVAARFGHAPDPFPSWHSSQAESGQNFASWSAPEADDLLLALRRTPPDETEARRALYARFEALLAAERPALTLYHPVYTYVTVDPALGGVQMPRLIARPADRYATLSDWFLRTERVFLSDEG